MGIVRIKRSSTEGSVPSGLLAGELAINVADRKLYAIDEENTLHFLNFTSDSEKVTSGPIAQALSNIYGILDDKLDKSNAFQIDGTYVYLSGLKTAANDAAAATLGVPINGLYKNGNALMIRSA